MSAGDEDERRFREDGYVVLRDVLDAGGIDRVRASLEPYEATRPFGRTAFEGEVTRRVYSLAGKGDGVFLEALAANARVLDLVDRLLFPNYLLSTLQSIRLYPGEPGQEWHTDDAFYGFYPRPRPGVLGVSVIWAIEDFTDENGATEIIPGSHLWGYQRPENVPDARPVKALMEAGSCIVFDGSLWHRGGRNNSSGTRLAVSPQYCQPWLRTQESQLLVVPPSAAARCSSRAQTLLGYSIHPPFLGQVDGMHPLRLCSESYREAKTHDALVAAAVLRKPKASFL